MKKIILPKFDISALPFIAKPYILLLNITQRCNLRCTYCFGKYYSEIGEMSFAQIKKILLEFRALGVRRLGISGGEALLYKNIDKVIKTAVGMGYEVGLNSNGILVPLHIKTLRLVKNLSISLDGATERVHDKYRGNGSFKKAIAGIEAAYKAGIPLHFCCTLTDANINEWKNVVNLAKKYRALVQISPLYPRFRGEGGLKLAANWDEKIKRSLIEIIKEKNKKGSNIFYSAATYRLILNWHNKGSDISQKILRGFPKCLAGRKVITMDHRGFLFPCVRLTETLEGQNCIKMGAKNAYQNLPPSPCKSCRWACFIEYNFLLNLKPSVILNYLKGRFNLRVSRQQY